MAAPERWTQQRLEAHVRGFERLTLGRQEWSPHSSHLATTVWYCRRQGREEALVTMRTGIQRLNAANAVPPELYHETVTRFFVTVVHDLVRRLDVGQDDAALANGVIAELGTSREERRALFEKYWWDPKTTLESSEARTGWVAPDRRTLDSGSSALDA